MGDIFLEFLHHLYTHGYFNEIADPNEVFSEQDNILHEFQKSVKEDNILLLAKNTIDEALSVGQTCGFYDGLKVAFNI